MSLTFIISVILCFQKQEESQLLRILDQQLPTSVVISNIFGTESARPNNSAAECLDLVAQCCNFFVVARL